MYKKLQDGEGEVKELSFIQILEDQYKTVYTYLKNLSQMSYIYRYAGSK